MFPKPRGAITLVLVVLLLTTITLIVIFAANYSLMQQKIGSNQYSTEQAYDAAEAGLEFGIQYLQANSTLILSNPVGGSIPSYTGAAVTNVAQTNGTSFTVSYTNPVLFNYNLIKVTSTGYNPDKTATRVSSQLVYFGSQLSSLPTNPLTVRGSVSLSGNAWVVNLINNSTIQSGGSLTFSTNASTTTLSGGSNKSHMGSDLSINNAALAGLSDTQFFSQYFASSSATVKSGVSNYYTTNFSSAAGVTGASIWIDGSASFAGNTTIGSPLSPVIMIVNGSLSVSGNFTVYGFLYVMGSFASSGNAIVDGGIAITGSMAGSGNDQTIFDPFILNAVSKISSISYFAKIAGSWKDY